MNCQYCRKDYRLGSEWNQHSQSCEQKRDTLIAAGQHDKAATIKPPAPPEEPKKIKPFEKMSKRELSAFCLENDIVFDGNETKEAFIELIAENAK